MTGITALPAGQASPPSLCWRRTCWPAAAATARATPAWTARARQQQRGRPAAPVGPERQLPSATATGADRAPPGQRRRPGKSFPTPPRPSASNCREDWIAQSVDSGRGDTAGRREDRGQGAEGTSWPRCRRACRAVGGRVRRGGRRKPYVVVSSVPVELPAQRGRRDHCPARGVPGHPGLPVLRLLRDHQPGGRGRRQGVRAAERGPRTRRARGLLVQ